jgi:hypothetical protein
VAHHGHTAFVHLPGRDGSIEVVPSHSFTFAATLQAAQFCDKPVLLRIEKQASHAYRPTDKRIAELTNGRAFTLAHIQLRDSLSCWLVLLSGARYEPVLRRVGRICSRIVLEFAGNPERGRP